VAIDRCVGCKIEFRRAVLVAFKLSLSPAQEISWHQIGNEFQENQSAPPQLRIAGDDAVVNVKTSHTHGLLSAPTGHCEGYLAKGLASPRPECSIRHRNPQDRLPRLTQPKGFLLRARRLHLKTMNVSIASQISKGVNSVRFVTGVLLPSACEFLTRRNRSRAPAQS
jgi:hypothetical protein